MTDIKSLSARLPEDMVYVEAGSDGQDAFAISRHEITNEQYSDFLEATGHLRLPAMWTDRRVAAGQGNYPVVGVSYADAMAYAAWASAEAGRELVLPSERQLKRASLGARIGRAAAAQRRLLRPVESDPADRSVYGVHDVVGSAGEWTSAAIPFGATGPWQLGFRLVYVAGTERAWDDLWSVVAADPGPTPDPISLFPKISLQPASRSALRGSSMSLTVAATANGDLSYQWYFNGAAIAGATASSLPLPNVQPAAAGSYWVVVTSTITAVGDTLDDIHKYTYPITSDTAELSVVDGTAPGVSKQPVSQTVASGVEVLFSASFSGSAPLTFKWSTPVPPASISTTETADSTTITVRNVVSSFSGDYSVTATNAFGSSTSVVAKLLVIAGGKAPSITAQPASVTVSSGGNSVFRVEGSGFPEPNYQWNFNGAALTGATGASLSISNVQSANAGNYTVSVSNPLGTVTSTAAVLTVNNPAPPPSAVGNSGGGGGAPSAWFLGMVSLLIVVRFRRFIG